MRKIVGSVVVIMLIGQAVACSAPPASSAKDAGASKPSPATSSTTPAPPDEPPPDEETPPADGPDATVEAGTSLDGGSDATVDGSADADAAADANVSANLSITSVVAQNVGRKGDTVRFTVTGADTQKQTTSIVVRLRNASDAPVAAFDTNWDGVPDAPEKRLRFETSTLTKATFTGVVNVPGLFGNDVPIAKVAVALEDATGARSADFVAPLTLQAIKQETDPCDTNKVADRCADGLSCSGAPATCKAGVAPSFTKVAYIGGSQPRMLFRGAEPDDDLGTLAVEFLDAAGNPKSVDLLDDGTMIAGFTIDGSRTFGDGTFFLESNPIVGFDAKVPKIATTPSDVNGHAGARLVTPVAAAPVKSSGQACDPQGFDVCGGGTVCSPGLVGAPSNTCANPTTLRNAECSAATVLDPSKPAARTAFGKVEGVSLWDPPLGCVPGDAAGRPETALKLHLASAASSLTITTALPETDFDTAVYLIPTCASTGAQALGCNDDEKGTSSTLSLSNVAAGDYLIIVESIGVRGGRFGLSIEAK